MSDRVGKDPKIHWVFKLIASRATLERIEGRRFEGLKNREGLLPPGITSDQSVIEFYTEKDQRNKSTVPVLEMEAKSAFDDYLLKIFGSSLFIAFAVSSAMAGNFEEIRDNFFLNREGAHYSGPAMALFAVAVIFAVLIQFFWQYNTFNSMDYNWRNALEGFFARNARAQMEAVRNSMAVFKRFLKWRRYMRLMMMFALIVLGIQVYALTTGMISRSSVRWSIDEQIVACVFFAGELIWLMIYFYFWVFYTTYRDPTLQLCVLVNVMDRATVVTPTIAERR